MWSLGDSALHFAIRSGDGVSITALLVRYGADLNSVNKNGSTPMELAIERGECDHIFNKPIEIDRIRSCLIFDHIRE